MRQFFSSTEKLSSFLRDNTSQARHMLVGSSSLDNLDASALTQDQHYAAFDRPPA
jgi:hypothetical protein